tara:strand:- start:3875 stop:4357 length:483 start_codon:yes stop_codon:yes gene_type:complete
MPCTKCKDDKYKWGKTGSCEYATKEECEKANKDYYKKNNTTMRPTPLGKTYEEYEKELKEFNLSSQKIELGIMDDLKKYEKELDNGRDELMQYATDAREAIAKGVKEMNRLDSVNKVAKRILEDAENAAKELGVKIPLKEIKGAISAYEQQKKSLTKVLK